MTKLVHQGARFKALEAELARRGAKNPAALAATIGRRKMGKAKFQAAAARGRKRAMVADTDNDNG